MLVQPSRSGIAPTWRPGVVDRNRVLKEVRKKGWVLSAQHLAYGIRSIAAPLHDGTNRVVAALNITLNAAETSIETLTEKYLPLLLQSAASISGDWTRWQYRPQETVGADLELSPPQNR